MPRLRRRALRTQQHFGPGRSLHLQHGVDFFDGYDKRFFGREHPDMRADWTRHGDAVTAAFVGRHPGRRPWGFWKFDSGIDLPDGTTASGVADVLGMSEADWLAEHGELTAEEKSLTAGQVPA